METCHLVVPSLKWKNQILAYKEAFSNEHLHGGGKLQQFEAVEEWLEHIQAVSSYGTSHTERSPFSTFLCIREMDQQMVGICTIRHDLNHEHLKNYIGHIGYSIHPEERRKGYATEQLRLALLEAKNLGIDQVLITAADWNIASQKTILANGGVYEDTRIDPNSSERMLRYWIENL
ncbi:GNAT family N-acetyltransferase [Streptococcus suis]|nr:GNAT family N-acetyltransferase [Streptococcus suis]